MDVEFSFTEEEIERYLRAPESMTKESRERIERVLRHSEEARRIADSVRSFYELLGPSSEEERPAIERAVDAVCGRDSVLHLRLIRHNRRPTGSGGSRTWMAAATEAPARPRVGSTSYGMEGSDVLVRVLHDRFSRDVDLYVLGDDPARCAFSLVTFPQIGLSVATNEGAHAAFTAPAEIEPDTWARLQPVVRLPLAASRIDLNRVANDGAGSVRGVIVRDHLVEFQREGGSLRMRVSARRRGAEIVSLATLTDARGRIRMADLSEGEGRLEPDEGSPAPVDPHTLRLYA